MSYSTSIGTGLPGPITRTPKLWQWVFYSSFIIFPSPYMIYQREVIFTISNVTLGYSWHSAFIKLPRIQLKLAKKSDSYGEKVFLVCFCLFVFFKHTWLPFSLRIKYILFEWLTRIIFSWPLDSSLVSSWPLLPTFNPIIQSSQTLSVPLKDLLLLGSQTSLMLFYHPFIYLRIFSAFSEPSSGQIPWRYNKEKAFL